MSSPSVSRCPICDTEASEQEVNRHLDKGCNVAISEKKKAPTTPSSSQSQSQSHNMSNWSQSPKVSRESSKSEDRQIGSSLKRHAAPVYGEASSKKLKHVDNLGINKPMSQNSEHDIEHSVEPGSLPSNSPSVKSSEIFSRPLAEVVRPTSLDQYIGQEDLVGPHGILRKFVERDTCPSIVLWGPSGVGKTTFARILAAATKSRFVELSATSHSVADCKKVFEQAKKDKFMFKRNTIIFLDEIHRFNRAQQDIFLPQVERGDVTLIGATTENPSFRLNGALLSRCRVLVLKKLTDNQIQTILRNAVETVNREIGDENLKLELNPEAIKYLAETADGDARMSLNMLEIALQTAEPGTEVSKEAVQSMLHRTHFLYDRVGDQHYDTISALHKSVRGSDPNAALYYLGRMLESGEDPLFIARRMVRMASEDIGQADDSCLPFAVATYTSVQQVGMPEADCILAHCAVKLAEADKSVRVYKAYNSVKAMLHEDPGKAAASIPLHIRNAPTKLMKQLGYGRMYKYNPDYKDGKVAQEYMPDGLENIKFLGSEHLGSSEDPDLKID